jgi:hypothetical protein
MGGEDMKKKRQFPIYALEDTESYGMTDEEIKELWQHGVDTGIVWRLQGWYGRQAQDLLNAGIIHYPKKHSGVSSTDFYGNKIPTQSQHETLKKKMRKMGVKL